MSDADLITRLTEALADRDARLQGLTAERDRLSAENFKLRVENKELHRQNTILAGNNEVLARVAQAHDDEDQDWGC